MLVVRTDRVYTAQHNCRKDLAIAAVSLRLSQRLVHSVAVEMHSQCTSEERSICTEGIATDEKWIDYSIAISTIAYHKAATHSKLFILLYPCLCVAMETQF